MKILSSFYQIYDSLLYGRSLHSDGDDDDELLIYNIQYVVRVMI